MSGQDSSDAVPADWKEPVVLLPNARLRPELMTEAVERAKKVLAGEPVTNDAPPAKHFVHKHDAICPRCGKRWGEHNERHEIGFHCWAPRTEPALTGVDKVFADAHHEEMRRGEERRAGQRGESPEPARPAVTMLGKTVYVASSEDAIRLASLLKEVRAEGKEEGQRESLRDYIPFSKRPRAMALEKVAEAARALVRDCSASCAICEALDHEGAPHTDGCSKAACERAIAALDATLVRCVAEEPK